MWLSMTLKGFQMQFQPHDYQKFAIQHILSHPESALLLDMGLGKTVITLTALFGLCLDSFQIRKALIIAPLRVARDSWPAEIEKWDHLKGLSYSVVVGTEKQRKEALKKPASLYIINRENVDWLINKSGQFFDFDCLVLDEMSSFKNRQTNRFKCLCGIRYRVKWIVGLTGTPAPNSLIDLWAPFRILDQGARLGRYITPFREAYFHPDKVVGKRVYSWKPIVGAKERIYNAISDITISMESGDYLHLPDCIYSECPVQMSFSEYEKYQEFMRTYVLTKDDLEAESDDEDEQVDIVANNAAVLSGKLLQLANGAIYDSQNHYHVLHDRKLDALEDLIEAANGKPVMVAYWYQHDLARIQKRFEVRQIKTSKDIKDWNAGKIPIAVIHPASAGHGLNLQSGGSTLVWFGLTWSLELYQQTNARLHRQGQTETVVIHHIICKDTIDEQVMEALKRKEMTQAELIKAVKANIRKEQKHE